MLIHTWKYIIDMIVVIIIGVPSIISIFVQYFNSINDDNNNDKDDNLIIRDMSLI